MPCHTIIFLPACSKKIDADTHYIYYDVNSFENENKPENKTPLYSVHHCTRHRQIEDTVENYFTHLDI